MDEWLAYRPHNIHQLLHQLIMSTFGEVKFGFDSQVDIKGKGIIMLQRDDGHTLTIKNVVFISSLKVNILNLGQMEEHGCKILMEGGSLIILTKKEFSWQGQHKLFGIYTS